MTCSRGVRFFARDPDEFGVVSTSLFCGNGSAVDGVMVFARSSFRDLIFGDSLTPSVHAGPRNIIVFVLYIIPHHYDTVVLPL